jgi:hypothetical protein
VRPRVPAPRPAQRLHSDRPGRLLIHSSDIRQGRMDGILRWYEMCADV